MGEIIIASLNTIVTVQERPTSFYKVFTLPGDAKAGKVFQTRLEYHAYVAVDATDTSSGALYLIDLYYIPQHSGVLCYNVLI